MAITLQLTNSPARSLLTADTTYYVRTDGNDNNNGLSNTAGGAFATWNKAVSTTAAVDCNGHTVTWQGNNATHTDQININVPFVGLKELFIDCAGGTISTTSQDCLAVAITASPGTPEIVISNVTLQTTTSGNGILIRSPSHFVVGTGVTFGACATNHIQVDGTSGVYFEFNQSYSITGGAQNHIINTNASGVVFFYNPITVTLTGTPAFSSIFVSIRYVSILLAFNATFSGAATGPRYFALDGAVIDTAGGGANFFPGNSAGATSQGGQYF